MIKKIVKGLVVAAYRCMTHLIPVKRGLVVFDSFMGKSFSGSVRAVYEWLEKNGELGKITPVWVFTREALRRGLGEKPSCRVVTYGTFSYYILMSRASVWVFDTRHEGYLVKKKKQKYIQTWHGTPLKKLGVDIELFSMKAEGGGSPDEKALERYRKKVEKESGKWDLLVSASPFTTKTFRQCFAYKGKVLECGYPRNDVLFEKTAEKTAPRGKLNMLYAPTWRDNIHTGEGWWYGYTPALDIKALERAIGDEWTLTVKLHYLVKYEKDAFPKECIESGFLRIADSGEDIAGLYGKADALVTDYSSVMFDYSLLDRPMFFFVYDLEDYRDVLRGWYFDFEEKAPGPLSRTTGELIGDIRLVMSDGEEAAGWREKRRAFREEFSSFEDGHASECLAKEILKSL